MRRYIEAFSTGIRTVVENHVFWPRGRLVELMSLIAMSNWLLTLLTCPGLFESPTYLGFQGVSQDTWAVIFGTVVLLQCFVIIWRPRCYWGELRFICMALSAAIWVLVTNNLFYTDAPTTATGTYLGLSIICSLLGVRFAWKTPYYTC